MLNTKPMQKQEKPRSKIKDVLIIFLFLGLILLRILTIRYIPFTIYRL